MRSDSSPTYRKGFSRKKIYNQVEMVLFKGKEAEDECKGNDKGIAEHSMNDFDWGRNFGRFFISWILNDDFCGLAIRIGKEFADDARCGVFHLTIQIGYGQFTIGIAEKEL